MDNNNKSVFAPFFEVNNTPFIMKMGNTTFEITTHLIRMAEKPYYSNLRIYLPR